MYVTNVSVPCLARDLRANNDAGVTNRYTGFLSRAFGEAAVMRVGAIWAILTGIVAFLFMRVN